jgi:acylphosphatase
MQRMADTVCRRVLVHGRVQGVFFRDSVRERAQSASVAGWVRNRSDGSVEAVLEGPPAAVESVIDYCRQGPPRAEVDQVEVSDRDPTGLSGFETC